MIFSIDETPAPKFSIHPIPEVDFICFFKIQNSIQAAPSMWWNLMCSSLRLKRSVLILGPNADSLPVWDFGKRWEASANWSWLTPRSLSVILETYQIVEKDYDDFNNFLKFNK